MDYLRAGLRCLCALFVRMAGMGAFCFVWESILDLPMTEDATQRRRWTFYEAVKLRFYFLRKIDYNN